METFTKNKSLQIKLAFFKTAVRLQVGHLKLQKSYSCALYRRAGGTGRGGQEGGVWWSGDGGQLGTGMVACINCIFNLYHCIYNNMTTVISKHFETSIFMERFA